MRELTPLEKTTYGADAKLHPVTKRPLEQGLGAAPPHQQALAHCDAIEAENDKDTADEIRAKVNAYHDRSDEEIAHEEKTAELEAKAAALKDKEVALDAEIAASKTAVVEHAKHKPAKKAKKAATLAGQLAEGHRYMTPESKAAGAVESHGEPNPLAKGERYFTETEEKAADKAAAKAEK
jgi:hypothetical protein